MQWKLEVTPFCNPDLSREVRSLPICSIIMWKCNLWPDGDGLHLFDTWEWLLWPTFSREAKSTNA